MISFDSEIRSFGESFGSDVVSHSIDLTEKIVHILETGFLTLEDKSEEVWKVKLWQWVMLDQNGTLLLESFENELVSLGL